MNIQVFKKLLQQELITEEDFYNIQQQQHQPVSVHWDLRTLLYLGIVLLTTALGILVYKNIDTIGHQVIIIVIAVICVGCFAYCFRKAKGYSKAKVESPNILFDYVFLLGCLLLLTFIGYIQYEYNVFGNRWGLALFIPMVLLFFVAYYFDHLGVLSIAITNLAAWLGITVTPIQILQNNDFNDEQITYTGLVLGAGLIAISFLTARRNIKPHFAFTYKNFGAHLLFISLLAALFYFENIYFVWFLMLAAVSVLFFKHAITERSFYFLVITVLYAYIGLCYVVVELLSLMSGMGPVYLGIIYFIASGIGLIRLLIHYNKTFKHDASL